MRGGLRIAALVLAALACSAPAAQAHALLEGTTPERGAALEPAPGQVVMRFSEPVEIAFGAIRVFDAKGAQVQTGEPFHPGGKGDEVAIRLRSELPRGGYTATYRVVSADSHPVSGGFVFSVGTEAAATGASVGDLLGDQGSGPVTSVVFGAARAVQYAAIALGIGVLAVLLLAWLPALRATAGAGEDWRSAAAAFAARARMLLIVAAIAGALSALATLPLQAATAQGSDVWSALGGTGDVLETRFGVVQGIIEPGQFQDFGLSLRMPEGDAGEKLTFKALQTYEGGEIVRWIGPEDGEEPAPVVTLEAAGGAGGHGAPAAAGGEEASATPASAAASSSSDDGGSDTLSIVALAIGALGLLAGLGALAATRRRERVAA